MRGDATIHGWDAWIGKGVMYKEDPIIKGDTRSLIKC